MSSEQLVVPHAHTTHLRDSLANFTLVALLAVSSVQLAPSIIAATTLSSVAATVLIVVEVAAFLFGLLLLASGNRFSALKPSISVSAVLAVGITITAILGPFSTGSLWLMMAICTASLFYQQKGLLIVSSIVGATLLLLWILSLLPLQVWTLQDSGTYLFTSANILLLPLILSFPIIHLQKALATSQDQAVLFEQELSRKQRNLEKAQCAMYEEVKVRRSMQDTLKHREAKLRGILDQSEDISVVLDSTGTILFAVGGVKKLLGWTVDELTGYNVKDLMHPEDMERSRTTILRFTEQDGSLIEGRYRLRTKENIWIETDISARNRLMDAPINGIVCTIKDVSQLRSTEQRLEFYECYDPLTELPNKTRFMFRLQEEINKAKAKRQTFAILTIGIDRFKRINDMYSTQTGDEILKQSACALGAAFRSGDLVSRLRGDVFLVLLSDLHQAEDIADLVHKALEAVNKKYDVPGGHIDISCTIGAVLYPYDGDSAEVLIKHAEAALYMAKESERGSWRLFDQTMNRRLVEMRKMEEALDTAIEEGSFVSWFQPKVRNDGSLYGMEALVRWSTNNGAFMAPSSFIPLAEKNGSINAIGELMLAAACRQIQAWYEAGLGFVPISVNVSPIQFRKQSIVSSIMDIVDHYKIDPKLIELELTESALMTDDQDSIRKLLELRELGFLLSIDDFGTGYSSFSKLKDYPIDTVKIDKSFISPLPNNSRAEKIASAILDLAHTLGCSVVAEGVETAEQLQFLKAAGCDIFQGFYFSHPLDSINATAFIKSHKLNLTRA